MYEKKIKYFDVNVDSRWSAMPYGREEMIKLDRLFGHLGSLKGQKLLEPGCGTGRLTEILADHVGADGLVVALDISPKMAEAALARTGMSPNVKLYTAALEDFPVDNYMFDNIICHQVFPHFEDKQKALSLLYKCLKKGGRIAVFHFINISQINDIHRKAGTAVEQDSMPEESEMRKLFAGTGLDIKFILNDDLGYFLSAEKI
ncbi:MAG: methyltransferase domain-containing protein [Spirochaetes bacterium]|nr:methyltransferase domain-containing protein [Spirochaetota bacterium]